MAPDPEHGLTFDQLRHRCPQTGYPAPRRRCGTCCGRRVRAHRLPGSSRRYELNGGISPYVLAALRQLS